MNTHKNARLTYPRRLEMVKDIAEAGCRPERRPPGRASAPRPARKWLGRYLAFGEGALVDKSSRPESRRARSPPAGP